MEDIYGLLKKCEQVCRKYERKLEYTGGDFFRDFLNELINMGYLIALSDGIVSVQELYLINETFMAHYDMKGLMDVFGMDYISDDSFLRQIPHSIKTVARLEKDENMGASCFLADTRTLYNTMKCFANMMINCDGARLRFEVVVANSFLSGILDYIFTTEEKDEILEKMYAGKDKKLERNSSGKVKTTRNLTVNKSGTSFEASFTDHNDNSSKNVFSTERESLYERRESHSEATSLCEEPAPSNSAEDIQKILDDVDAMIGLGNVKKEIHDMVNLLMVQKMREERGLKGLSISKHLVFTGNPGTGKTTIARYLARIYKSLGMVKTGQMIETDRSGLVSGYMGQTAEKVKEVCEKALGGILFVDEAYSLVSERTEGDFGKEAVDTLLKIMEDERDNLVVIVAGYPDKMEEFLDSNPGLRSRFNRYIHFEDYSVEELVQIFKEYCAKQDYHMEAGLEEELLRQITELKDSDPDTFGNARAVRNYFERVISNQANRIVADGSKIPAQDMLLALTEIKKVDLFA